MELTKKLLFLESFLGKSRFNPNKKEATFSCVFCNHHKEKLSINLEQDRWQCWVCGKKGRTLVPILKQSGSSHLIKEYLECFKADSVKEQEEEIVYRPLLPKSFQPLCDSKGSFFEQAALSYLKSRGITDEQILKYKIGIAQNDERYSGRIILPSFDKNGNLNLFQARLINSNINKIKYTQDHVPKGYVNTIILNELNLDFSKPITLVEGFFDMINANENCTFLVGSNLSTKSKLFEEIVKNQTDVYLALDPDASKKQDQIAREFLKYDISVFSIDVSPFKDVGEMTRQAFDEKYKEAKQITKNNFLLNKIRALA